ncbi:MAG TPA: hypothetical protein PKI46_00130 [Bacteroidales bacterium]|nr:hypothetical protein [Bacteroidales bacterium]
MTYIKCIISCDNEINAMKTAALEKCNNGNWLFLPTNNKIYREIKINRIINKEYRCENDVKLIGDFEIEEIDKIKNCNKKE